jgi:hypothetical protein
MSRLRVLMFAGCVFGGACGGWAQTTNYFNNNENSFSSTYEEGVQRGFASIIQARGSANLMNSEAAGNYQQAYSQYLNNRMQATETYFGMRDYNRKARAAEAPRRATAEDLARYAKIDAPKPLSVSQLDPLTGFVSWPLALREDAYAQQRAMLEGYYKERAKNGQLTLDQANEVKQITAVMQEELKSNIRNIPPQNYVQAKKFLEGITLAAFSQSS